MLEKLLLFRRLLSGDILNFGRPLFPDESRGHGLVHRREGLMAESKIPVWEARPPGDSRSSFPRKHYEVMLSPSDQSNPFPLISSRFSGNDFFFLRLQLRVAEDVSYEISPWQVGEGPASGSESVGMLKLRRRHLARRPGKSAALVRCPL
jgi:hypothetical protein